MTSQQEFGTPLVEDDADHLYLKGCSGSKGNFRAKGADKGMGKGKGTDNGKGISTCAVGLRGCTNRMIRIQTISTGFAKCYNNQFPLIVCQHS